MKKNTFVSRPLMFLTLIIAFISLLALQGAPLRAGAPLQATEAATEDPVVEPTAMPLSGDPVVIGIAVAQTSNVALLGQEEAIGAQIAEEFFNRRGGINGRPIKLVFQDTAGDEAGAINSFNTLINDAKVYGIVGPTLSQQAFAADPIADKAGVPVVAPSNTAAGIPQIGKYISRVSAPVAVVAPNAVKAALEINPDIKKVAVFFAQNDAFSKSETGTFQETVKSLNLELLPVQTFQTTDTDFTTQATTALAGNPDLVIVSGLAADGGNLVKQLRDLGFKGLIIGGNGLNTANIYPVCKAQCDGIIIAQAYSYSNPSEINRSFRAAYKAKQQKEPPQFSAQTFTGVQVIVEALRKVDAATPLKDAKLEDARAALLKELQAGTYDTPLGEISFTKVTDDKGNEFFGELVQKQFYVAQINMNEDGTSGQFIFIK
jgi:branched-chain amino acid transport system substrate-binding protein